MANELNKRDLNNIPTVAGVDSSTGEIVVFKFTSGRLDVSSSSKDEIFYWDDTTTANIVYLGYAVGGSATSASVWKIAKVDTVNKKILLADGNNNYDNKYDDRATTVVYS